MIRLLCVFYLSCLAYAAYIPETKDNDVTVLSYDFQNDGKGNYRFNYETSNGISRNETGQLVNAGQDNEHISVHGFYSYIDPEGNRRAYEYTADENGYDVNEQPDYPLEMPISNLPPAVLASIIGK